MKTIKVEISETGEVKIEAIGFTGKTCEKATAELEKALGKVKATKKKPEYYSATVNTQNVGGK